ncbi:MAG: C39 family peptidase [Sphingomonas bacterium]
MIQRARLAATSAGLAAGLLLLSGCARQLSGDPHFMASAAAPLNDFTVPVASMQARRFNTVVRQQYDFSCGSAALATLLHYHYGDPQSEEDVFRGMWRDGDQAQIRRVGFSLLDMKRYLAARGLRADGYKVSLQDIAKRGIPGIVLITVKQYRHFVVLKGIAGSEVLLGDPSLGLRTMAIKDFLAAWNGIYFVLNSRLDLAPRAFNVRGQWASLARAPVDSLFLQPLSQQALALALPSRGDY